MLEISINKTYIIKLKYGSAMNCWIHKTGVGQLQIPIQNTIQTKSHNSTFGGRVNSICISIQGGWVSQQ